jgi:SPP1 gp7 family putative phage head morphogenesis protein
MKSLLKLDGAAACCGAHAAEQILDRLGVPISKAIDPTTKAGFLRIVAQVRRALQGATAEGEAAAVRAALNALDVDWPNLSSVGRDSVIEAARQAIGTAAARAMPRVEEAFRIAGRPIMGEARAGAVRRFGLKIETSLSLRDLAAERYIRASTANFIRDSYGVRRDELANLARETVARGLAEGVGRDQIARDLHTAIGDRVMRGQSYWQVVANQFVAQARTFSQLGAYGDAGIEAYRFVAVLDEVTTDQCRFYDGKVFSTREGVAIRDRLVNMTDPDQVYATNPWVRSGTDDEGNRILYVDRDGQRTTIAQVDRSGVGARDDRGSFSRGASSAELEGLGCPFPPLHANCRSETEPVV